MIMQPSNLGIQATNASQADSPSIPHLQPLTLKQNRQMSLAPLGRKVCISFVIPIITTMDLLIPLASISLLPHALL